MMMMGSFILLEGFLLEGLPCARQEGEGFLGGLEVLTLL